MSRPFRIDICVPTFRRTKGLKFLLESLSNLNFRKLEKPDVRILIIDNDPEASARGIWEQSRVGYPWLIDYLHEPRRGISFARNAAVKNLREEADFLVFVDDDEVVDPFWLDELVWSAVAKGGDIVTGPVLPRYLGSPPKWLLKGRFLERPRHGDGQLIDYARTGNVLIARRVLERVGPAPFDERLGLIGGEDTIFFAKVLHMGFKICWADRAVVLEWQFPERYSLKWLLMRAYRTAYVEIFVDYLNMNPLRAKGKRLLHSLGRILVGGMGLFLSAPLLALGQPQLAVKSLRLVFRGLGMLGSLFGLGYREYSKPIEFLDAAIKTREGAE